MNPVFLRVDGLCKSFASKAVVADLSLDIQKGELISLLGPSGCGKTTTLRLIGGFLSPDAGSILLDGTPIQNLPPEKRPVCTVFQSYALFPHMTVLENVMYGLRCHGVVHTSAKDKALNMLKTVGLGKQADMGIRSLSGGQQQRVALARALVLNPKVLLLDEPFSNLDAGLKIMLREEVRSLQEQFELTTIFVTHDREEAMALSNRIAVMQDGRIAQIDSPRKIYSSPVNLHVAEATGQLNKIRLGDDLLFVRPEDVILRESAEGLSGTIISVSYLGLITRYYVECSGNRIVADVISDQTQVFQVGEKVHLSFRSVLSCKK
ncbi:ABC transporter ATP-binding protein [Maridesulfovibrio sp.]|uniref:ABC transporter ATP-binding protein n=1 Tax=Maridesulfovibrio sp. TaxID=2795000 RepID=UPI002A1871B7|nr:ABC transporter ATP-binding protein [Maridesulfovibrio sp.]